MLLKNFRHWLLPDHPCFILLFFTLIFQQWIPAIILYIFTFLYDVLEEQIPQLKRLEMKLKEAR